jgi:hypothetical protein
MYPKLFTFDPVTIERARMVTLKSPNLDVLPASIRADMPGIAHFLESGFKARDADRKLFLPDLSALHNSTIGIFSDYGGEEKSARYATYSFMICAFGSLGPFKEKMAELRTARSLGHKEIAFKDFRMGHLQRFLPDYLQLADRYVLGMIFTLAVDRTIPSLFGPGGPETNRIAKAALEQVGYLDVPTKVAEKLFRIVHTIAFLVALLGHTGQKIFWMTDNDAIGATPERHTLLLKVLDAVLPLYTTKTFAMLGGARPFEPKEPEYLDLLSFADITAGSLSQLLGSMDTLGPDKAEIKEGGNDVLRWLCHDSTTLKKLCITVKRDAAGTVCSGPVNFEAKTPVPNEIFLPSQLLR